MCFIACRPYSFITLLLKVLHKAADSHSLHGAVIPFVAIIVYGKVHILSIICSFYSIAFYYPGAIQILLWRANTGVIQRGL